LSSVLNELEIEHILENYDAIIPSKRYYPFFTIESHYIYTKGGYINIHKNDIKTLRTIIKNSYPDYMHSLEKVLSSSSYHPGSLFIMKKYLYNQYCEFLFSISFELENYLNNTRKDKTRYVASIAELLLDVWLYNNNISYKELPLIELEKKPFPVKLFNFLRRMITGYYKGTIEYKI
jgi:hypothetical protein